MSFDYSIFDALNGLAGRYLWLDTLAQWAVVYGALIVLLISLGVCWWPRLDAATRKLYLTSLVIAVAGCVLLYSLEWVLTTQVLQHDLRARPANARWVTLLLVEESGLSFPAWPIALAMSVSVPVFFASRPAGILALACSTASGIALVFAGLHFPFDVITGAFLGIAVGYTACQIVLARRRYRSVMVTWGALCVWGAMMALTIRPVHGIRATHALDDASISIPPPGALQRALEQRMPGPVQIHAASNGRLLVASIEVQCDFEPSSLREAEALARQAVNVVFLSWSDLDLLTIEILGNRHSRHLKKVRTLYTVTISRHEWPTGGFAGGQRLPGKKYFYPGYY